MLNQWRLVEYTDDGCSRYECLACHGEWEARTSPLHAKWKFCPACGTQWEGQLRLAKTDPDLIGEESTREAKRQRGWKVYEARQRVEHLKQPWWQLQNRGGFFEETPGQWENDGDPFQGSFKMAWSWLSTKRRDQCPGDHCPIEYRIVQAPRTSRMTYDHSTGPKLDRYPLPL